MRLVRKWSPLGYDRAVALFQRRFYDHSHFFRTVHGFLVQFGISYTDDEDLRHFASHPIQDDLQLDPPILFEEGTVSYAGSGPNSRDSQLFVAYDAIDSFVRFFYFLTC
jgi:cyclophilin family peptidyl-prolyl cis-trans isomerase